MDQGSIYNWLVPQKKLYEMEDEKALQVVYKLVIHRAEKAYKSKYFRKTTKYSAQSDFNKLVYFHEIATSLLVETKLLLLDYQNIRQESRVYSYVAENIGTWLIDEIKSMGVKGKTILFWKKYLKMKEENISARIIEMREMAIKNGSNFCRALVDMPENLIVRSSASDAYDFFTAEGRGDINDKKLRKYILDVHTQLFERLKRVIL